MTLIVKILFLAVTAWAILVTLSVVFEEPRYKGRGVNDFGYGVND